MRCYSESIIAQEKERIEQVEYRGRRVLLKMKRSLFLGWSSYLEINGWDSKLQIKKTHNGPFSSYDYLIIILYISNPLLLKIRFNKAKLFSVRIHTLQTKDQLKTKLKIQNKRAKKRSQNKWVKLNKRKPSKLLCALSRMAASRQTSWMSLHVWTS